MYKLKDPAVASLKKTTAVVVILISGVVSWLIANIGIDTGNMEMAAIANVVFPVIAAVISMILFLLLDWIFKNTRFWIMLGFFILNLLCGYIIRVENVVP